MRKKDILAYARWHRRNPTPAEAFFWERVRKNRILGLKCKRQYIVKHRQAGRDKRFYIADFAFARRKLIIELDGPVHQQQVEYDAYRQEDLEAMGFCVLRFTNKQVLENWPSVERKIRSVLTGRDL